MLITLIKIDLYLLKVALIFWSKILLSRCVDYFIKGIKKACSPCIVELHKHLGIFKNIREVREALAYGFCFRKHFSRVVKTQQCTRRVFYPFNICYILFI